MAFRGFAPLERQLAQPGLGRGVLLQLAIDGHGVGRRVVLLVEVRQLQKGAPEALER